jgi:hypothetical protein
LIAIVWIADISYGANDDKLTMVRINSENGTIVNQLARMGIDITAVHEGEIREDSRGLQLPSYEVEAVISPIDMKKLKHYDCQWTDLELKGPRQSIGDTYTVYHSFDESGNGIKDQLYKIQNRYNKITQIEDIGHSIQNRPILAMRLGPKNYKWSQKKAKPQVLFLANLNARDWIATEIGMRLIYSLAENYGKDSKITDLLDTVDVWVIPVANPDGYEYTFTTDRLWTKNLRDNDGDGQITIADGVNLNRNFDAHWGLNEEGSSAVASDLTYHGTTANSEPETRAISRFINANNIKFIVSYNSYGDEILYPWSWQVKTPSLDNPLFVTQAGTDETPAIVDSLLKKGYDPGIAAEFYTVNGSFSDWCYGQAGIPFFTVKLTDKYGFEFPDDESLIQTVFQDNLPFALAVAQSANNPAHPVSPVGLDIQNFYHTPLSVSYGPEQMIEILAPIGADFFLHYSINGQKKQNAPFSEKLGYRYNESPGVYFSRFVATIPGQKTGDKVTYEITIDGVTIGPFSYTVAQANVNPVLLMGNNSNYLKYYKDSLDTKRIEHDIWEIPVKANVPDYPGILSHYKVIIWYSGDEIAPNINDDYTIFENEVLAIRDFINFSNGKLMATGQDLAYLATVNGIFSDDFFQYYLGSMVHMETGGMRSDTDLPFNVTGESTDPIFAGLTFSISDGDGANNQRFADTFLNTTYLGQIDDTQIAARYVRPDGPFKPHSGKYYVYSKMADNAYKRIGGTFDVPTDNPTLTFWISYDIEPNWDYAFVEIAPAGTDEWTTLPDENGLTVNTTGKSCPEGWVEDLHPHLDHYMENNCQPFGSTGEWHAFTGDSNGWKQVRMDLSAYAGQTVELYISYASDWTLQKLGVFIDDITLGETETQTFETVYPSWTVTIPPGGDADNNWEIITKNKLSEGPIVRTADSIYFGFGFEAIDDEKKRDLIMQRAMDYLMQ